MDSLIDLQQPVLSGSIHSINFFNGRLLSARDLTLEQSAYREADRRLGTAVGDGIAYGLEVSQATKSSKQSPAVSVEAGLAVNQRGQTLMLDARADIALVRTATALASSKAFSECEPLQTGAYVAGAGVYLLTIAPAQTTEGRATTNGMNPASATCNSDTIVNAVQFRLIQLDPPITSAELQDKNHLRNLVAYKCFGSDEPAAFIADPFGPEVKQWGLLDSLRPNQLTECEVPLAVLYWTDDGINFIDMWSVRRRVSKPSPLAHWNALLNDRQTSEGEARFQQFADEINDVLIYQQDTLDSFVATDQFSSLPAAGVIPLGSNKPFKGFDPLKFFQGITTRAAIFIEGSRVSNLIRNSFAYPPIDLASGNVIWLYFVRENFQAPTNASTLPYLVFASGYMPYLGDAHFDLSHWNYSNYTALEINEQPKA
jgi:hypothetical protein